MLNDCTRITSTLGRGKNGVSGEKGNLNKTKLLNTIFGDGLRGQRKWDMLLLFTTNRSKDIQ